MTPQGKNRLLWGLGIFTGLVLLSKLTAKDKGGQEEDPTGNGGVTDGSNGGYVFNAKKVADALYHAMYEMGTDEDAIIAALKPVGQSDFAKVVTAFGQKQYNPTFGNQYSYSWEPLEFYGLPFWLKNELSDSTYNTLRNKYPNQL